MFLTAQKNFPLKTKNYELRTNNGFTLIEMIVSVSIFTIVVFVSVGALLAITDANRKANALRTVMDNLNFAIGSMARNLRTGDGYVCDGTVSTGTSADNCSNGGSYITFTNQDNNSVTYRYDSQNKKITVDDASKNFVSAGITSPEIIIDSLTFYVTGVGPDGRQPRVIISIKGTAGLKEKIKTKFSVQTTVSQRKVES